MESGQRVVTSLPIAALWDDGGEIAAARTAKLSRSMIKDLLRAGPVRFVIADVGHPLRWIGPDETFEFWKRQGEPHLADPGTAINLDHFPKGLAYRACHYLRHDKQPLILLEAHH